MLLAFFARKMSLRSSISQAQIELMRLNQRIMALQQYAANIADGIITPDEMAQTPFEMAGRQMMFSQQSFMTGYHMGNQALMNYLPQYRMQMSMFARSGDWNTYNMMRMQEPTLQMNFMKQAMEKVAKQEQAKLHVEEKKVSQQKATLEMRIKLMEQEFNSLDQAISQEAQRGAPKYTGLS